MTKKFQSYRDLTVWQRATELAVQCYATTKNYPKDEMFGLVTQTRQAAISVAANIAEGHGRESSGAFVQFLRIAQGSLKELETHLIIAQRVDILAKETVLPLLAECEELGKMLRALIRSIQAKQT